MNLPTRDSSTRGAGASRLRAWLRNEWLLALFGTLVLALALFDPQPLARHRQWLQVPTLAGLAGLLMAIQGVRDSGMVQHAASATAARMHSLRGLGLLLVSATAALSMVLTNDVSLFLIVPLTVALGELCNLPITRMVVLEALAVNAGSTLSPIGNPQNLLLWQHAHRSFGAFAWAMLPTAAVMFALVTTLTWLWLPRQRLQLSPARIHARPIAPGLGALSIAALLAIVLLMEYRHALAGAIALLGLFALVARDSLARVDWLLLLTFAAIFLGLGHAAELAPVSDALDRLDLGQPLTLYLSGIVLSQLISNVPATVLLLDRAPDIRLLALAVNVGGFGLIMGSMANIIALRLAKQPHGWRLFHLASIPFLLICAPLVYWLWRAFGSLPG